MDYHFYEDLVYVLDNETSLPDFSAWSFVRQELLPVWNWGLPDSQFVTFFLVIWLARICVEYERRRTDVTQALVDLTLVSFWGFFSNTRMAYKSVFRVAISKLVINYVLVPFICFCFERMLGLVRRQAPEPEVDGLAGFDLKPRIFPCTTSHTRMFPKVHSFSYSYLMVGIPVGWQGEVKGLLSADTKVAGQRANRAWFTVEAEDYLDKGHDHLDLLGKLRLYLRSQGELPQDYPIAYLITAPKFLRYSFNPVSFWYLYSEEKKLKAMILEVNNTFDERRIYFLKGQTESAEDSSKTSIDLSTEIEKEEPDHPKTNEPGLLRFKDTWTKDFHVSPFNSRKGSYSLVAHDPFVPPGKDRKESVNNTITLSSSKGHPKLIARVFSAKPSKDPSMMSRWSRFYFVLSWWWVGFATFPRIATEAAKLFFKRKLHVWYRPEVSKDSIGRAETVREALLEQYFRQFLKGHVENSPLQLRLRYTACGRRCQREELFAPDLSTWNRPVRPRLEESAACTDLSKTVIELKVLTPLFYSRLARATSMHTLYRQELLDRDERDRSLWCNEIDLLLRLFPPEDSQLNTASLGPKDWLHWNALRKLRKPPTISIPPLTSEDPPPKSRNEPTPSAINGSSSESQAQLSSPQPHPPEDKNLQSQPLSANENPSSSPSDPTITSPPSLSIPSSNLSAQHISPPPPTSSPYQNPFSPLDTHILTTCTPFDARKYRRTVSAILLSDYAGFLGNEGNADLFDGMDFLIRIVLAWACMRAVLTWWAHLFVAVDEGVVGAELGIGKGLSYGWLVTRVVELHVWWVVKEWGF
ncbi:hypothetical protein MMC25_002355 [Agyrium rufum]|nr:hypothetical protein [Agyrium rufum]